MQLQQPTDISRTRSLDSIARILFLICLGLTPLMVVPVEGFPFLVAKIALFSVLSALAFVCVTLSALRVSGYKISVNKISHVVLLLVGAYALSTVLSQDWKLSLIGTGNETDSFAFIALAALVFFLSENLFRTRESIRGFFKVLFSVTALVGLFQVLRLFAGEKMFANTVFATPAVNLVGSWNDFGIFMGLLAVLAVTFIDSRRASMGKFLAMCGVLVVSLGVLAIVNFVILWWLLIASALLIAYGTSKGGAVDTLAEPGSISKIRIPFASLLVVIVAGAFLLWGNTIAPKVQKIVQVSQPEAQLTSQTTLQVTRSTYAQSALTTFFGSGPNTFAQQWLLYKPASLTSSQFWTLDFASGFSTLLTSFVTGGLLVGILFLLIPVLAIVYFFKAIGLIREPEHKEFVIAAGAGSVVLFGALCFYAPGQVVELYAFSMLGVLVAWIKIENEKVLPIGKGNMLVTGACIVAVLVSLGIAGLYVQRFIGNRYESKAMVASSKGDALSAQYNARRALALYRSEETLHLLAMLKFADAQKIAAETDKATESTRAQRFQTAFSEASDFANAAVTEYPSHWNNWLTLAQMYEALIPLNVEGAYQRSENAYANAIQLSPRNPQLYLMAARMYAAANNEQGARSAINQALTLKPNYTDAILFIVQLEIAKKNLDGALNAAAAAVQTAPDNAGLWFELGVLAFNKGDDKTASAALQKAITLAPDYANAKYFLALAYYRLGQVGESVALFEKLAKENPDNAEVATLLATIKSGKSPFPPQAKTPATAPVKEN